MTTLALVADLRALAPDVARETIRSWAEQDPSGMLIGDATIVAPSEVANDGWPLPPHWRVCGDPLPAGFWDRALTDAGQTASGVLALLEPVLPGLDAAGVLLDLLDADPMFGAACAREQCRNGCCIRILAPPGTPANAWMPQETLAELSPQQIVGDLLPPALVVTSTVLTEFGDTELTFVSLAGALLHRLTAARRCGFRTVVANRAVMRSVHGDCARAEARRITPVARDLEHLKAFEGDSARTWREFGGAEATLFETLTSRQVRARRGAIRPSLLLDMRNLGATYNGTSFAAMGAAQGLYKVGIDWDIAILANAEGARFHDFAGTFPGWTVHTTPPPSAFNVALRLSQPWHIQEMIDLHHLARVNAYLMLDTIAWDVVYAAPPHLDGTWQFLATTADGLLFISDFSRQRFRTRFPVPPRTAADVCHLAFDPADYTCADALDTPESDYYLVIGNHLDHKDVAPTTELLASAFPLTRIATLGPAKWRSPQITAHHSGTLAEIAVHRLYAAARLAIFPSFYEGFGLPVVAALAYGRTLFARESALLDELAPRCVRRGRLITYRRREELVDLVGRLAHGQPVADRPLGAALNGGAPRSWEQVGLDIHAFLHRLLSTATADTWRARAHLVAHTLAYRAGQ